MLRALGQRSDKKSWRHYAAFLAPLLIVALAASARLAYLLPVQRGLLGPQDYDEAVWTATSQLLLQGYVPYRDFFATLPPVGIYLLAAVLRLVNTPWGSGLGLMATRYASVVYGAVSVGLVYLLGRKLAGPAAGLLAAGLLAVDGAVVLIDHLAMLEPPLNLFSLLAMLAYLGAFEQSTPAQAGLSGRKPWLAALSGLLAAAAASAKTPGAVVVLALVTVSLLRRRWREAWIIALSFVLGWVILSAYFLLKCPGDFLKQVYFFQFLRPPDGVVYRPSRLYEIWRYASSWLTVRAGLLGGLSVGLLSIWRRRIGPWLVVLAWAGYTFLLILANSSYYPQYYVQLAVPLCLLAGGLLGLGGGPARRVQLGPKILLGILTAGLLTGGIARQAGSIAQNLKQTETTYTEVASYIQLHTSPEASILVFEPNYTFLSSRQPAGAQEGHFLVDSYGGMLYLNLGIQDRSLWDLAKGVLTDPKVQLQTTFWAQPAQEEVLAAFERADLVVVDGRARYQLEPQTLAEIQRRSTEVFTFGVASLRKKVQ